MGRRGGRTARVAVALLVLVTAAACQHAVEKRITEVRDAAGVARLTGSAQLKGTAKASAERMCAAGAATPSPDPALLDPSGFARAVAERVGSAALDPGAGELSVQVDVAVAAIWSDLAPDPVFVEARWDEVGVDHVICGDGRLYLSAVLRDSPPGLHPEGKTWLFAGQELGAVGGFPGDQDQGYVDYVGMPAGVTIYTTLQYAAALDYRYDVGWGISCGYCYVDSPAFDGTMLALGLQLSGDLPNVLSGARDDQIAILGEWIRDSGRMVFLRIGYEFDLGANGYDPAQYKTAFQRIVTRLRAQGVTNFATVWQSTGSTRNVSTLMRWYPGDDVVDWVGYSYFNQTFNPGDGILDIARQRRKPAMIAEATPKRNLALGVEDTHWSTWFAPFFARIAADQDVIKAVAYINTRWFDQAAWSASWGDSRVQIRPTIKARWIEQIQQPTWAAGDVRNASREYVLTAHDLTPP